MINKKIVIVGYSGHSYGCIEVALDHNYSIVGYYDISAKNENPYNLKYLGHEKTIKQNDIPFISIGDNSVRKKIYEVFESKNICLNTCIVHKSSIISKTSLLQNQTFVNANVIINPQSEIGVGCIINSGAIIEHDCVVGKFSHVAPGAVLLGNVSIGVGCMIGSNSVIKQGVSIGDNVLIGAGSVVLNDLESNSVYVGNPARKI